MKTVLSLLFINRLSIDLDEPFSIFHAQKSISDLLPLFESENNPPLHFVLLHFWVKCFGIEPFAVRSLSLIFSVLTLPVLFYIGRTLRSERLGLILMVMFTFSNFHHSFGIEARGYALFTLLFSLAILLILRQLKKITWQKSILFGLICAALFYTHYIAIIVIPFLIIAIFFSTLSNSSRKNWFSFGLGMLFFIFALLPFLPIFLERLSHVQESGTWVETPHWSALYGLLNKFLNGPIVILSFAALFGFVYFKNKTLFNKPSAKIFKHPLMLVALITFGIYLSAFVLSVIGNSSVFLDRYLFFLSIGLFILLAFLVEQIAYKNLKIIWLPLIIFVFGFNPFKTHNRESDALTNYALSFDGSYIITPPHYDLTFVYHADKSIFEKKLEGKSLFQYHIYPIHGLHEVDLAQLKKPIVLIDAGALFLYGEQKLKSDLSAQFELKEQRQFLGGYEVLIFE